MWTSGTPEYHGAFHTDIIDTISKIDALFNPKHVKSSKITIQYIYGPTCCKIDRYHSHIGKQCDTHASGMAGQMSLEQDNARKKNNLNE